VRFKYELYDAAGKLTETAVEKFEMRWQTAMSTVLAGALRSAG